VKSRSTGRVAAVPRRSVVLLAAAAITMAGCNSSPKRESSPAQTVRPSELVAVEGPAPAGRFYVKAGADDLASDLYEVTLPSQFKRLTTGARISTVGGCATKIVVAAAQKEVGYLDTLQELKNGQLVPVEKLGPRHAFDPDLSPDCRLLFHETKGSGPTTTGEIRRFDPATGVTADVVSGPTVTGAAWGPDGQVLVLRREQSGPKLDIIGTGGTKQEIDPKVPDVGNTPWGKSGWIAMAVFTTQGQPPTATLFVNPTTGQRSTLDGWRPLAWSPSGDQLLVREATKGTTLAVVDATALTKTRNVGVSDAGTVWDAVWLPA
jgi:hypothetical protein